MNDQDRSVESTRRNPLARFAGVAGAAAILLASAGHAPGQGAAGVVYDAPQAARNGWQPEVRYRTAEVDGLEIFFREAGPEDAPVIVLLHGFPTSSHMYRDLIPMLSDRYRVIAPDFPGFGNSSMPSHTEYDYTFASLTDSVEGLLDGLGVERYSLYLMDYGAPVGYRLATRDPERVESLIVQNGNAYVEGLADFWDPIKRYWASGSQEDREALHGFVTRESTEWQFVTGVRDPKGISPDNYNHIQPLLDRPGNRDIQMDLFYDYRTNVDLYPQWQAYFREYQPPTLIVWGKNDPIFPDSGAYPS